MQLLGGEKENTGRRERKEEDKVEELEEEISEEEIRRAIGKMKTRKAVGVDGISMEAWKFASGKLRERWKELLNQIWKEKIIPYD